MESHGPTGITWHPSRRPQETVVRQATAGLATGASIWPGKARAAADAGPRGLSGGVSVVAITILVVVGAGVPLAARSPKPVGCAPITYALVGSPPDHARVELDVALGELHLRSGLVFEQGDPHTSSLQVIWSEQGVTRVAPPTTPAGHDTVRHLGFGGGTWQSAPGGVRLVAGIIEIDATVPWHLGLDRGNGLAAIFVHELGHVVGLAHSPIPGTFMHHLALPHAPRWTPDELDRLAEMGRRAGCGPPGAGADA